jgi:hypothetical protein
MSDAHYNAEYNTGCPECRCNLTCDFGNCACGKHKIKMWLKNLFESMLCYFFLAEFVAGIYFLKDDLYSDVYDLTNGTICKLKNNDTLNINAQTILLMTGIFGFFMMVFRLIHFNTWIYRASVLGPGGLDDRNTLPYYYVMRGCGIAATVCFFVLCVFTVFQFIFLFVVCSYFDKLFFVYIISIVFNVSIISGVAVITVVDNLIITRDDWHNLIGGRSN